LASSRKALAFDGSGLANRLASQSKPIARHHSELGRYNLYSKNPEALSAGLSGATMSAGDSSTRSGCRCIRATLRPSPWPGSAPLRPGIAATAPSEW
jgi:hypothetical protein